MRSAWDVLPDDLRALGWPRDPKHFFGQLQRISSWDPNGPVLAREARELATRELECTLPLITEAIPSTDGSTRLVLTLADGARIEAVHMPRKLRRPRVTICLSSQVGCAMGCTFCATARMGLVRNLAAHEIIGQLFAVLRRYGPTNAQSLNLVFMGMGEPLHNVDAVIRTLDVLCDPAGLGVPPSRITVSTAGHVAGLDKLATAKFLPELAVSINAATDATRRELMPVNKKWNLEALRAALTRWPQRPHQKLTFEYVLLDGVNDSPDDAERLADFVAGFRHIVNVIPFNAWSSIPGFKEPSEDRVRAFTERLHARRCIVTVRRSRGRDVRAACGTLVA
jgi:23S rRNA (adenine2503-C2)-methyltransferase